MKILKYFLYLILIVIIGGAVYFGTQDGTFDIAETKFMDANPAMIYENVNDFKNWQEWGPWIEQDPNMELKYAENTVGEGASYSWSSEVMGDGSMKTVKVVENAEIDQTITFNSPLGESTSDIYWRFNQKDNGTEVTWGMKGEHSLIEKAFMAFQSQSFEVALNEMHKKGLANLDSVIQTEMNKYTIDVQGIKQYGGGYYMYTTTACKQEDIGSRMAPMMGKVHSFLQTNKIAITGMPFTIYNDWDEANGTVIFSAAIPVKEKIITTGGDVLCGYMEPLSAVKTVLKGNYNHLSKGYEKAQQYIGENNLLIDPSKNMFEIYANDPGDFPNPADWTTEIYIPVFKDLTSNHPIINGN
ncbi:MAG: AraC family transcriptional regulator [Flavobacteriaceae bacterium]|nr:AraC family transcriptional regulator [Flavobacteriaceae bacterium]